jgi:radical SAM protein with 4Fe4S-binding SPASM domain
MPWTYLEILTTGDVTPCCASYYLYGNVKEKSVDEIWNDAPIKQLRLDMFKDEMPEACRVCKEIEETGSECSLRIANNEKLKTTFDDISKITNKDGSISELKFRGWDFKLKNKCNFRCRTCTPWESELIAKENKEIVDRKDHFISVKGSFDSDEVPTLENTCQSVTDYFETVVATGSGPNGTITTYDVLGLALDSENFASYLGTCTTAINTLQGAGTLNTLNTAYTNILLAANDAGVLTQITNANNAITAISANPQVTILNTAWVPMATNMNLSAKYIQEAGLDYFQLQPDVKSAAYSFTQNLAQYGLQTENEGACEYLEALADTTILGGQAIIGAMREGRNQQRINAGGMFTTSQVPSNPAVVPAPVILPVNT